MTTRARNLFEARLAMLADIARGKVRCGWRAGPNGRDVAVVYVAGEDATPEQRATIRYLHLNDRIQIGTDGQYELTPGGRAFLNTHYPTWES